MVRSCSKRKHKDQIVNIVGRRIQKDPKVVCQVLYEMCCQMKDIFQDDESEDPAAAFFAKLSEEDNQSHEQQDEASEHSEEPKEQKNYVFQELQRNCKDHVEAAQHGDDSTYPTDY